MYKKTLREDELTKVREEGVILVDKHTRRIDFTPKIFVEGSESYDE